MDDVESQAPHGDTGVPEEKPKASMSVWWIICIAVSVVAVIAVCVVVPILYYSVDAQYSVKIDSVVSGRDNPTTGLSFNLTFGVASRSHGAKACINPGMLVEVFYRGVQVAVSEADARQACAGPLKTAEMRGVAARATGVPVGHVLDILAAEMKQGAAVFDFKLNVPANSFGRIAAIASWSVDCKGARVGDAAAPCESPVQS